uniref:Uncharacterized protein n=1 Tax=Arundo donax TaxID=35708 RepID=A0A0A9G4K7_ARUDO
MTPSDFPGWFMLSRIMGVYMVIPAQGSGTELPFPKGSHLVF